MAMRCDTLMNKFLPSRTVRASVYRAGWEELVHKKISHIVDCLY